MIIVWVELIVLIIIVYFFLIGDFSFAPALKWSKLDAFGNEYITLIANLCGLVDN